MAVKEEIKCIDRIMCAERLFEALKTAKPVLANAVKSEECFGAVANGMIVQLSNRFPTGKDRRCTKGNFRLCL